MRQDTCNALDVIGLSKKYKDFKLDDVTFSVPAGTIVGLIGENGAGKSTTLKCILGLAKSDGGTVEVFGKPDLFDNALCRTDLGIVFDDDNFPRSYSPKKIQQIMRILYRKWDDQEYLRLLKKLDIPYNKALGRFSKGMRVKHALAVAFSHHASLLVLDEPTSGLDPIVREEVLDLLLDYVADDMHSVLISSHISSDLKKVCDSIVFLHKGNVVFQKDKDELLYRYGILRCTPSQFDKLNGADIIRFRPRGSEIDVLVEDRKSISMRYPDMIADPASLDDIMLLYVKGATGDKK